MTATVLVPTFRTISPVPSGATRADGRAVRVLGPMVALALSVAVLPAVGGSVTHLGPAWQVAASSLVKVPSPATRGSRAANRAIHPAPVGSGVLLRPVIGRPAVGRIGRPAGSGRDSGCCSLLSWRSPEWKSAMS